MQVDFTRPTTYFFDRPALLFRPAPPRRAVPLVCFGGTTKKQNTSHARPPVPVSYTHLTLPTICSV
eukprot:12316809-Alexandrium_andersonii.AAC.1